MSSANASSVTSCSFWHSLTGAAHIPWTCPYTGSPERRVTIAPVRRKNVPCSSTKSVLKANRTMSASKELDIAKKSDNVVRMIERAYMGGIRAAYALMDTWFVKAPLVCAVRKIGSGAIHVVGRLAMGKDRYAVGSRRYNVHEPIAPHEREAVVCRKHKCMYFEQRMMMGDICSRRSSSSESAEIRIGMQ